MHNARLAIDHHVFSTEMPVVGCARLHLSARERLYFHGARFPSMPHSISLSWPESGGTAPIQAVSFRSLSEKLICLPTYPTAFIRWKGLPTLFEGGSICLKARNR